MAISGMPIAFDITIVLTSLPTFTISHLSAGCIHKWPSSILRPLTSMKYKNEIHEEDGRQCIESGTEYFRETACNGAAYLIDIGIAGKGDTETLFDVLYDLSSMPLPIHWNDAIAYVTFDESILISKATGNSITINDSNISTSADQPFFHFRFLGEVEHPRGASIYIMVIAPSKAGQESI